MDRLIILHSRPYDFEDRETRKRVVGRTVWAIDPDSMDPDGLTPFKLKQLEVEFFPRAMAIYRVEYRTRTVNGKREQLISGAEYLEQWLPLSVSEMEKPHIMKRAQAN